MTDLLAHVAVAYVIGVALAHLSTDFNRRVTTLVMVGALVPDLSKVYLFVDDDTLEAIVGGPVEWLALHTGIGVLFSVLVVTLFLDSRHRRIGATALAIGAGSHLVLDSLLRTASGEAPYALLWPLTLYRPPTPGLYLSTEAWPTMLAMGAAAAAYLLAWRTGAHSK
jgi:hypothetical protein